MLSNKSHSRRKWSFEKGRNSSSVLLAALVTAAVFALVLTGFRYDLQSTSDKRQSTEVLLISIGDTGTLDLISRYDSSRTYRINTGGVPFCCNCRRTHAGICTETGGGETDIDLQIDRQTRIPQYEYEVTAGNIGISEIPASGQYAPVLPHPQMLPEVSRPQVVSESGEIQEFPRLNKVSAAKAKQPGIIRFTGSGLLMQSQIIQSSGDPELDAQTAGILKASGIKPGIYTVIWPRGEK